MDAQDAHGYPDEDYPAHHQSYPSDASQPSQDAAEVNAIDVSGNGFLA